MTAPESPTGVLTHAPHRIGRSEHCISRRNISANALKVLNRLHEAGHRALLVGGGVRDLLLGEQPKDFDVATDATPEQVRGLFRNCRLIGRRFRLAHVHFGREVIEVATFRGDHREGDDGSVHQDGRILRDNVFGTLEEDARRRDFTVNALYYDIDDFSVIDFTSGMADLQARVMRLIGDPQTRYREDPVRMLRALRFAAKPGFSIDPGSADPIRELGEMLAEVPPARLFEEVLKLFQTGNAARVMELLREYEVLEYVLPLTDAAMRRDPFAERLVAHALENTDARIAQDKPVTPAFLYAAFLWPSVAGRVAELRERGEPEALALQQAGRELMPRQLEATALPKRFALPMREIWELQPRLVDARGKHALRLLSNPRFRAAYDFLCLRAQAGETAVAAAARWWTELQEKSSDDQAQMAAGAGGGARRGRRRRRRRRRPSEAAAPSVP